MHVNRAGGLAPVHVSRIDDTVPGKDRLAGQCTVVEHPVELKLVLPLQRDEDPLPQEIQVARLEAETTSGSYGCPACEDSILVAQDF